MMSILRVTLEIYMNLPMFYLVVTIKCSLYIKLKLYGAFCICFYEMAFWHYHTIGVMNNLDLASIFRYQDSVTHILLTLGVPSHTTVQFNAKRSFTSSNMYNCNHLTSY